MVTANPVLRRFYPGSSWAGDFFWLLPGYFTGSFVSHDKASYGDSGSSSASGGEKPVGKPACAPASLTGAPGSRTDVAAVLDGMGREPHRDTEPEQERDSQLTQCY